ncbi:hypothetical protein B0I26_11313 [Anoxybacillus vitaminiphilus]|uniref:Uncharacterized protein n=1 Tax=Paranoxybacillus vitaminiphilus TaxID=581036 RepID=A0A327YF92_9BACL|nr:hypothetical protein [Anoxybacillus vitaminiphilus]RAK17149.1 hypothetical protein B0I26_11313 [Anoxybacillus vitaminiphilus]
MNKEKFKVDFPSDEDIARQISFIVKEGLPKQETFFKQVYTMYRQLGFQYLFPNSIEIAFISILIAIFLLITGLHVRDYFEAEPGSVYTFIFVTSPLLYLTICSLSLYHIWDNRTYELEMTCKYDFFQLTAVRMLAFSIFCFAVNTAFIIAMVNTYHHISFVKAFLISTTGLFLFSTLTLFVLMNNQAKIVKIVLLVGWTAGNFLAFIWSKNFFLLVLNNISISVYVVITASLLVLYIKHLQKMMQFRKTEGVA